MYNWKGRCSTIFAARCSNFILSDINKTKTYLFIVECYLYVHKEKLFYYFLKYFYCISRQIMKSLNKIHFIFLSSTFCTMMSYKKRIKHACVKTSKAVKSPITNNWSVIWLQVHFTPSTSSDWVVNITISRSFRYKRKNADISCLLISIYRSKCLVALIVLGPWRIC